MRVIAAGKHAFRAARDFFPGVKDVFARLKDAFFGHKAFFPRRKDSFAGPKDSFPRPKGVFPGGKNRDLPRFFPVQQGAGGGVEEHGEQ